MRTWMFTCILCIFAGSVLAETTTNSLDALRLDDDQVHVYSPPQEVIRVAVAQPDVVDLQFNARGEMVIFPLRPGSTSIVFWDSDEQKNELVVTVVPSARRLVIADLERIQALGADISWEWQQSQLVLRGAVAADVFARLSAYSAAYSFLDVSGLTAQFEVPVILELELHVVEVSRRFIAQTGLQWDAQMQGPGLAFVTDWLGSAEFRRNVLGFAPDAVNSSGYLGWAGSLTSTLHLLQERGQGRVLATPRVRVESGESADFLVGGELPIPQMNAQGMTEVTFKPYGIRLAVQPERLQDGSIRTLLNAEISHPDQSVTVQGVPGLRSRRASTQVVSGDGDTVVIAGLVSSEQFFQENGLPLGRNHQSVTRALERREMQDLETDLVIFVTAVDVAVREAERLRNLSEAERLYAKFMRLECRGMVDMDHRFGRN